VKKFASSQNYSLVVQNVEYLQSVKDNRIERFTIHVKSKAIDDTVVNDLMSMMGEEEGNTELYFNIKDEENNTNVLLRASNRKIEVQKSLVQYVEEHESMSYSVN
jgi:DNA polymerase-3 subunit alpha